MKLKYLLSIICLLVSACSITPQTIIVKETMVVKETVQVVSTVEVTRLVTVVVTSTPAPTSTTAPTATKVANTTKSYTTAQVVAAFKAAGLEAENSRPMTPADYGLAPLVAVEGTRFFIPSLGAEAGGRAMSFNTLDDMNRVKKYYDDLARSSAALFSWVFLNGNILIQINGTLPENKARLYESTLNALFK